MSKLTTWCIYRFGLHRAQCTIIISPFLQIWSVDHLNVEPIHGIQVNFSCYIYSLAWCTNEKTHTEINAARKSPENFILAWWFTHSNYYSVCYILIIITFDAVDWETCLTSYSQSLIDPLGWQDRFLSGIH